MTFESIDAEDVRLVKCLLLSALLSVSVARAQEQEEFIPGEEGNDEVLREFDQAYRLQTGEDTFSNFDNPHAGMLHKAGGCYRASCHIFANVVRGEKPQKLYLYIDGKPVTSWKVSTARAPYSTPNFDGHPAGPFYPGFFTSKLYPGGDYRGLGNMPYASFYSGHYAIHGTGAIGNLGNPASHGCVRSHPENAQYFSKLVRSAGSEEVWVTVSQGRVGP